MYLYINNELIFLLEGLEKSANDLENWLENMVGLYLYNKTLFVNLY